MLSSFSRTCVILVAAAAFTSPAMAAPTVSSSSYGASAALTVGNVVHVGVGPVAAVSGVAPAAYNQSLTVASVNQSLSLVATPLLSVDQSLTSGILTSTAQSAFPTTLSGSASATIANLGLALTSDTPITAPLTLIGLSANAVSSFSSVSGVGNLAAMGSSSILGLQLTGSVLGSLNIDGALFANPSANTVLVNLLGLRILLNEQIASGDGVTGIGIQTNAIHASFTNFLIGTQLLNGDIIVGHSQAAIAGIGAAAVPEPASWAMLIAGFGMIGGMMRRRTGARYAIA